MSTCRTDKRSHLVTASTQPLAGRRALVTGAASGIGAACARALAAAGAHVIAADLDAAGAAEVAGQTGGEPWTVDLIDTAALESLALDVDALGEKKAGSTTS